MADRLPLNQSLVSGRCFSRALSGILLPYSWDIHGDANGDGIGDIEGLMRRCCATEMKLAMGNAP
jgi:hypothetical protein